MTAAAEIVAAYRIDSALASKIVSVAHALQIDPAWLANVINFESGFRSTVRNPISGATGLIQFMPSTAKRLGTTTDHLASLSAVQQMDWVYTYFKPYKGKMRSQTDVYMAVFYPAALGKGDDYRFPSSVTNWNPGIYTAGDYVRMANARAKLNIIGNYVTGALQNTWLLWLSTALVGSVGMIWYARQR